MELKEKYRHIWFLPLNAIGRTLNPILSKLEAAVF